MNKEKEQKIRDWTVYGATIGILLIGTSIVLGIIAVFAYRNVESLVKSLVLLVIAFMMILGLLLVSVSKLMQKNLLDMKIYVKQLEEANDSLKWSNKHLKDNLGNCEDQLKWIFNIAPDKELDDEYKKYLFRQIFLEEIPVNWDREGRHKEI